MNYLSENFLNDRTFSLIKDGCSELKELIEGTKLFSRILYNYTGHGNQ